MPFHLPVPLFFLVLIRFWYAQIEEILRNSATCEFGGVYYYTERGDRLIDLGAFHGKLLQVVCPSLYILVMLYFFKNDQFKNYFVFDGSIILSDITRIELTIKRA